MGGVISQQLKLMWLIPTLVDVKIIMQHNYKTSHNRNNRNLTLPLITGTLRIPQLYSYTMLYNVMQCYTML